MKIPKRYKRVEKLEGALKTIADGTMVEDDDGPVTVWADADELREVARTALAEGCPLLTPEEEAELVERINANPNLHPTPGGPHE